MRTQDQSFSSYLRSWLQLLRVPNLATVPGDPIAGFFLASGIVTTQFAGLAAACLAGLSVYAGGLLLNDLVDQDVDARERPDRPLPAGSVRPRHALIAIILCFSFAATLAVSCGVASIIVTACLIGAVVAYNLWTKRIRFFGEITLGMCRSLNLLLGVAVTGNAVSQGMVLAGAAGLFLYVTSVSVTARFEADETRAGYGAPGPVIVVILMSVALLPATVHLGAAGRLVCLVAALLWACMVSRSYMGLARASPGRRAKQAPISIGLYIRGLIPLQAWLTALDGSPASLIAACLVIACLIPATWLGRLAYGS